MTENPYWPMLASVLKKDGVNFIHNTPDAFTKEWLRHNRDRVSVLHIHYCQQFYAYRKGKAKLSKVLGFAGNLIYARFLGYRVVFTLHNLVPTYGLEPTWMDRLGYLVAAHLSDRVIVHCQEAKRLLARKYGRRRKVYLVNHPNFIETYKNEVTQEQARQKLGFSEKGLLIFSYFGGIRPNKGIENVIKAFQNLHEANFRLIIAGNINKPKEYSQSLVELAGSDNRISFIYQLIPDDEIQFILNASDIIVLPFTRILTSSSVILAMSFKKPVIIPNMGCLPELVELGTGWLFEPDNVSALTEVMRQSACVDFIKYGQNAFQKVQQFSQESFGRQTQKAYWD